MSRRQGGESVTKAESEKVEAPSEVRSTEGAGGGGRARGSCGDGQKLDFWG